MSRLKRDMIVRKFKKQAKPRDGLSELRPSFDWLGWS
jgi:hypothetical protein